MTSPTPDIAHACEIAVVGGGPAGLAAAITLARAGRRVTVFEANAAPAHKVCGEFLSGESLEDLRALGVDLHALGALPIRHVRLASPRGMKQAALPFPALSLTRRTLDEALLRRAESAGVEVRRPCRVLALSDDRRSSSRSSENRWLLEIAGGSFASAREVVLASGKHDLRHRARPEGSQPGMLGLKMYFRLAPQQARVLSECVELFLHPQGYTGLQPVEGGLANLSLVVHRTQFSDLGGNWNAMLSAVRSACPELDARLAQAEPQLDRPLAISPIPYGFVRRDSDGPWYVGDQAAVIPSFTGDGISMALHSGRLAGVMMLEGSSASAFARRLRSELHRQVGAATLLARVACHAPLQSSLLGLAERWPQLLGSIAAGTRISSKARRKLRTEELALKS